MSVDPTVKGAAFDIQGTQNLRQSIANKSPEGVKEAAKQFESLLTHSMIKAMRSTVPKNAMFSSQAEEMYLSLFDQQLADDIAHTQNGLGLAKSIEQQLGRQMGIDMNNAQQKTATPNNNINTNININTEAKPEPTTNNANNTNSDLATIVRTVSHQSNYDAARNATNVNANNQINNQQNAPLTPSSTPDNKNNKQNLVENNQTPLNAVDDKTQDEMMRSLVIQAIYGLINGEINFNEFQQNINQIDNKNRIDDSQKFVHFLNLSAVNNNVNFQPSNDNLYNASAATLLAALEMQQQQNLQNQKNQQSQQIQQIQQIQQTPQNNLQNTATIPNHLNLPMATSNLRHIPVAAKTSTSATYARMGVYPSAKTQQSLKRVTENIDLSSLTNLSDSAKDFIKSVWNDAQKASQTTGIDAKYLIAHAALESGWGQYQPGGKDNPSYNLFGIKANKGWNGRSVGALTTEYIDGIAVKKIERFRAYNSYAEGFEDYARFLKENPRYEKVLQATSGSEFAHGLQKAGYATDPAYANKLKTIMKNTNLDASISNGQNSINIRG